ncbi:MAG: nickel pincer cofactor biosynthesis protein LarC [Candidatus Atribacteria bacterium]|nr:nickel pincer cofactor biosynthesis protein LarC [Candidatus Atribacteria bacterium]
MFLYCDCFSGISGDMFLGALVDLGLPIDKLQEELAKLKIPFFIQAEKVSKGSIQATQIKIIDPKENHYTHHGNHHYHRPAKELVGILQESDLPPLIKEKSISLLWKIAQAEAKIHGRKPEDVFLHEVGGLDTLIDISGTIIGLHFFQIKKVFASTIPTGFGFIETAHGKLPIPAPATVELLKGVPIKSGHIPNELTTPTGAVLIANLVDEFGPLPHMIIEKIGYGAGYHDFETPNVLRLFLGCVPENEQVEENILIETNLDDMSPQIIEYVSDKLFDIGALDVFTTPIFMKKQRPAIQLSVIFPSHLFEKVKNILFQETTTLGFRFIHFNKIFLTREDRLVDTTWGKIRVKISKHQKGFRITPEYEECRKIAQKYQIPLLDVIHSIHQSALETIEPNKPVS